MPLLHSIKGEKARQIDSKIGSMMKNARPSGRAFSLIKQVDAVCAETNDLLGIHRDEYLIIAAESDLLEYANQIISNGECVIDTETDSLDPRTCNLAGVVLYTPGLKSAYAPIGHISYITGAPLKNQVSVVYLRQILTYLTENQVRFIMHNAPFDIRVILHTVGARLHCHWDTLPAHKAINTEDSAALKDIHFKYCNSNDLVSVRFDKLFKNIKATVVPIDPFFLYAAGDGIKTYEVCQFQKKYLNRQKMPKAFKVFYEIEMPIVDVVVGLEEAGVKLDLQVSECLQKKYHKKSERWKRHSIRYLAQYSDLISDYAHRNPQVKITPDLNVASSTQLCILFYDILKYPIVDKKKGRSTGVEIIHELVKLYPENRFLLCVLGMRKVEKLLNTYIDKMPKVMDKTTGKVYGSYNQSGTATGRFSSSDPNMENIPSKTKGIRPMFSADSGYIMISADYKQQEPRLLACLSNDPEFIRAYLEGRDIYSWIASAVYNVPYEDCLEFYPDGTKNKEGKKRRSNCKSIVLGLMYGRRAKSIAEQIDSSPKEAQKIIDDFFARFPYIRDFFNRVIEFAKIHGYVETASGRRRYISAIQLPKYEIYYLDDNNCPDKNAVVEDKKAVNYYFNLLENTKSFTRRQQVYQIANDNGYFLADNTQKIAEAERQAINAVIQGSAADMMKKAMILTMNDTRFTQDCGGSLIITVHDENLAQVYEDHAKEAGQLMEYWMMQAASEFSLPFPCDIEYSYNWDGPSVEV